LIGLVIIKFLIIDDIIIFRVNCYTYTFPL